MSQHTSQGCCRGNVDVGQLGGGHVSQGALAQVDGAQRQREGPEAAALGQLPCRETPAVSPPSC